MQITCQHGRKAEGKRQKTEGKKQKAEGKRQKQSVMGTQTLFKTDPE
jgi:hypothetical protein